MTELMSYKELTFDEQLKELAQLVDPDLVQKNQNVKGPYTTGDVVEDTLRRIFGPDKVSVEIIGSQTINISASELYSQANVRLHVEFANGRKVYQDAIGIWPLKAGDKAGGMLENTPAERYETVIKAAVTDALKACAERLGRCFRPMSDQIYAAKLGREAFQNGKPPATPKQTEQKREAVFGKPEEPKNGKTTPDDMAALRQQWGELWRKAQKASIKLEPFTATTTIEQLKEMITDAEKKLSELQPA